jgi:hypothetical protein
MVIGGDDEYNGSEVLLLRATPITRRITDWAASAYTATIAPAVDTLVASGEAFELRRKHLYADVVAAINSAITDIIPVAPQETAPDTSLVLVSKTYEYDIPESIARIHTVEIDTDEEGHYSPLDPPQWTIRPGGKLWIGEDLVETYVGSTIRLSGYSNPSTLSTRTDSTPISVPYILAYCDWYLYSQLNYADAKMHDSLYKIMQYQRNMAMTQVKPNTKTKIT